MKKGFFRLSVLLSAIICLTSCLGSSDDNNTVYYKDTAVLSFTLGAVNRYYTSTADDGTQYISKETYSGSQYKFYIDQVNREIYNPDSLPYGTDAKHLICTITTKNSGSVGIKSLISDTVFVHSTADSVDFSQPRHVIVYAMDGSGARDYTVKVNVHQQKPNDFVWTAKNTSENFQNLTAMKGLVCGERLYVAGSDGISGSLYSTALTDGDTWTRHIPDNGLELPAQFYENIAVSDGKLYALIDGKLWGIDGDHWPELGTPSLQRLLGSGAGWLFGIATDGTWVESRDGLTWNATGLDADAALLPTQDVSFATSALKTDNNASRIVMTGNRAVADYPEDKWSVTWVKVADDDAHDGMGRWMYCPTEPNMYLLPRMRQLTTVTYGDGILALGAEGIGACTAAAFAQIYDSLDGGLNWLSDSRFVMPSGFSSNGAFALACDADNYLWLIAGGSGQVWRGRLNQLGWEEIQRVYR